MTFTRNLNACGHIMRSIASDVAERWLPSRPPPEVTVSRGDRPGYIDVAISDDLVSTRRYSLQTYPGLLDSLSNGGIHEVDARYRLSSYVRLMARALVLKEHPEQVHPAWSFCMPRLFRDVLVDTGLDPLQLAVDADRFDHWEPQCIGGRYGERRTLRAVDRDDDRIVGTISLHDGTRDVTIRADRGLNGACTVILHGVGMPETAIAAIGGLRLRDVVDHAGFASTGETVVSRAIDQVNPDGLQLALEPDVVWLLSEAPGIDLSWQRIGEGRLMPLW